MTTLQNPLRLNVGFLTTESVGFSRVFEFDLPSIKLEADLSIEAFAGTAKFERTQRGLLLNAHFSGTIINQCVRCLDEFNQKLDTDFTELFAFDHRTTTDSDLLVPDSGMIDLAPLIREYMLLDLPLKPLCKQDCAGLCPICGINLNHETCDCQVEQIDPRLSKLKDLLDDSD